MDEINTTRSKLPEAPAIEPEHFRAQMLQPFESNTPNSHSSAKFKYLINPFSIDINMSYYRILDKDVRQHPYPRFQFTALISSISLIVKPELIDDLKQFMEYYQYQLLIPLLKRYLPRRRPLTTHLYSKDPGIRRVRRQIIKDWF